MEDLKINEKSSKGIELNCKIDSYQNYKMDIKSVIVISSTNFKLLKSIFKSEVCSTILLKPIPECDKLIVFFLRWHSF